MKSKIVLLAGLTALAVLGTGLASPDYNDTRFNINFSTLNDSMTSTVYNNIQFLLANPTNTNFYNTVSNTVTVAVGASSTYTDAITFRSPIKNTPPYTGDISLLVSPYIAYRTVSDITIPIYFVNGVVKPVPMVTVYSDETTIWCRYEVLAATASNPTTVNIACYAGE